jgi:hypothetical protein
VKKREKRREKEREREKEGDDIQRTPTTGKKFESLHSFITQGLFLTAWTSLSLSLSLYLSLSLSVSLSLSLSLCLSLCLSLVLRIFYLVTTAVHKQAAWSHFAKVFFSFIDNIKKKTFFCQQVLVDASRTSGAMTFAMTTLSVMTLSMTEKNETLC